MSDASGPDPRRGIRLTVVGVLAFMLVVVAGFVHRIGQPRLLSEGELQANGLYLIDPPRDPGAFALVDHRGDAFTAASLQGRWTLIFFGLTYCPDICPTTMTFLNRFVDLPEFEARLNSLIIFLIAFEPTRDLHH